MQRRRDSKMDSFEPRNIFPNFGSFGSYRSIFSNLFGRNDPFDDSFFTRQFGGNYCSGSQFTNASKSLVIEEISSDDEGALDKENSNGAEPPKVIVSCVEPFIEHPDDIVNATEVNNMQCEDDSEFIEMSQSKPHSFSYKKVTYGGVNGAYYSASNSRRAGSDGVVLEENTEADKTTGRATHRVSRGINEKGHSITSNLGPDGKVDTTQTLHNLEKEELSCFDEAWNGNARKKLVAGSKMPSDTESGWSWRVPMSDHLWRENEASERLCPGKAKKVVRINID